MPHVTDDILQKVIERGYATNSGEFAAWIAYQSILYLKYNGWGFNDRGEVESGLRSAYAEWCKHTDNYEDIKAEQNGNIFSKLEEQLRPK